MMKKTLPIALLATALGAPIARAQYADVSRFVPLVTMADTTGHCGKVSDARLREGEQGFKIQFGTADTALQVVSAIWDSTGKLVNYSDGRGDLRGPPTPDAERGPHTLIMIDMAKGMSLLVNESHGVNRGSLLVNPKDALRAPQLGPPSALLQRLHRECGAPATQ